MVYSFRTTAFFPIECISTIAFFYISSILFSRRCAQVLNNLRPAYMKKKIITSCPNWYEFNSSLWKDIIILHSVLKTCAFQRHVYCCGWCFSFWNFALPNLENIGRVKGQQLTVSWSWLRYNVSITCRGKCYNPRQEIWKCSTSSFALQGFFFFFFTLQRHFERGKKKSNKKKHILFTERFRSVSGYHVRL